MYLAIVCFFLKHAQRCQTKILKQEKERGHESARVYKGPDNELCLVSPAKWTG